MDTRLHSVSVSLMYELMLYWCSYWDSLQLRFVQQVVELILGGFDLLWVSCVHHVPETGRKHFTVFQNVVQILFSPDSVCLMYMKHFLRPRVP